MKMQTVFSQDRVYRYTLWRSWAPLIGINRYAMFVGLNPSTADETMDDPTIRRCVGFAKRWGYDALCMTNLFAYRATDPRVMARQLEPVGADNDRWLTACAQDAGVVVAAWGAHGKLHGRDAEVLRRLGGMMCLGITKDGFPRHPLYVKGTTKLQVFIQPASGRGEK